jgi:hypothetical protein
VIADSQAGRHGANYDRHREAGTVTGSPHAASPSRAARCLPPPEGMSAILAYALIACCCYGLVGTAHPASPGGVSVIVKTLYAFIGYLSVSLVAASAN